MRDLCALVMLGVLAGCAHPKGGEPCVARPLVLEAAPSAAEPGWSLAGSAHDAYVVRRDLEQEALVLEPVADTYGRYGTWMRHIDAAPYRGKRVRISALTRTEDAKRRVDFWARAQAKDSPADGPGLGSEWKKLPSNSDWSLRAIVMDVAERAAWLEYGVGIAGPGKVWVDGARVEVVGPNVGTTGYKPPAPAYPRFDRGAAGRALAAVDVGPCKRDDGPTGGGHVSVIFAANGVPQSVLIDDAPQYPGTEVGACITYEFRKMRVPPFEGQPVPVGFRFEIR